MKSVIDSETEVRMKTSHWLIANPEYCGGDHIEVTWEMPSFWARLDGVVRL
jgi:hypothetical protein